MRIRIYVWKNLSRFGIMSRHGDVALAQSSPRYNPRLLNFLYIITIPNKMDCGPSNAVKNLAQYSQRDNSIQNDVIRNQNRNTHPSFKQGHMIDDNLNQQFNQFNNEAVNMGGNQFANQFMDQFNRNQMNRPQMGHATPQMSQGNVPMNHQIPQNSQNHKWVNDFSNLSLAQQAQHPQAQQQGSWNQQFMNQNQSVDQYNQLQQRSQGQIVPNYTSFQMNTRTNLNTRYEPTHEPNRHQMTEHQEVHHMEHEHQQFEQEFQQLEQEMQHQSPGDQEEFAKTAQKIHDSLNQTNKDEEMKQKLENSQFMKLMNSISNRQVELSEQGDKLVDRHGEDIRTSEIDYHQPQFESPGQQTSQSPQESVQPSSELGNSEQLLQSRFNAQFQSPTGQSQQEYSEQRRNEERQSNAPLYKDQQPIPDSRYSSSTRPDNSQSNRLPDPLAHIQDGSLSGINEPLQAAHIISGNQVRGTDWMEDWEDSEVIQQRVQAQLERARQQEYDAYRHDDDYS